MFTRFGRQIFKLYEARPLLMNSIIGGTVYVAGEYTVQTQHKDVRFFNAENWRKLGELGALGAAENGLVMMSWYSFLNRFVGSGVSTNIVLLKCLLDQMFFATQQDLLFLGLCAYNESVDTNDALQEVKDTFLTTWIVDCSLWPVVNFVGFAFVPMVLQPTYMAFVSYFWQLYLSSAASRENEPLNDNELEALFHELDTDNVRYILHLPYIIRVFQPNLPLSQYIDAAELHAYFKQRKIAITSAEVTQMIADADLVGRGIQTEGFISTNSPSKSLGTPSEQLQDDGKVSFEEFKLLATKGDELHLKTSALWASVRQDISLSYGSKHAIKRMETFQNNASTSSTTNNNTTNTNTSNINTSITTNNTNTNNTNTHTSANKPSNTTSSLDPTTTAAHAHIYVPTLNNVLAGPVHIPPLHTHRLRTEAHAISPFHCTTNNNEEQALIEAEQLERENALKQDRAAAIDKASVGATVLTIAVLIRKFVFKL